MVPDGTAIVIIYELEVPDAGLTEVGVKSAVDQPVGTTADNEIEPLKPLTAAIPIVELPDDPPRIVTYDGNAFLAKLGVVAGCTVAASANGEADYQKDRQ